MDTFGIKASAAQSCISPEGTDCGICGPTGATMISPALNLAARAESLSLNRKEPPVFREPCIRTLAASMYSCQAASVSGLSLIGVAAPGRTSTASRPAQSAIALNECRLDCLTTEEREAHPSCLRSSRTIRMYSREYSISLPQSRQHTYAWPSWLRCGQLVWKCTQSNK